MDVPDPTPRYRLITAVVILALYVGLCGYMIFVLSDSPLDAPRWDHALVIFNAFGAIATTAAGVLLGTEIQQQNVDTANRETARVRSVAKSAAAILDEDNADARTERPAGHNRRAAALLLNNI